MAGQLSFANSQSIQILPTEELQTSYLQDTRDHQKLQEEFDRAMADEETKSDRNFLFGCKQVHSPDDYLDSDDEQK